MKTKIEAPWYTYQKKMAALFDGDSDIDIGEVMEDESGEANYVISIVVSDHEKYLALERILPYNVEFGNVTLRNIIYDAENIENGSYEADLYKKLFNHNLHVQEFKTVVDPMGTEHTYLLFKPEVIQFFNDDISDYNGKWSGLCQDIAREIFDGNTYGINFCTANTNVKDKS